MNLGLKGKVAIVAASSKGLGRGVAELLAAEGALVTINGRDAESLNETARAIEGATGSDVLQVVGDVTRPNDLQRLVDATVQARGGLDVVVCNAGGPPSGTIASLTDDQIWEDAFDLNFMSTLRLSRLAIPHLRKRGGGSITNIVSVIVKQPIPHLALSNSIRAGIIGLAKTMSLEYAGENIRVNNVCPSSTLTDRIRSLAGVRAEATGRSAEELMAEDAKAVPLGRLGTVEEFANVVVFVASPAASYLTGTTIQVDGGAVKGIM